MPLKDISYYSTELLKIPQKDAIPTFTKAQINSIYPEDLKAEALLHVIEESIKSISPSISPATMQSDQLNQLKGQLVEEMRNKICKMHAKSVSIIKKADDTKEAISKIKSRFSIKSSYSQDNENKAANAFIYKATKKYSEKIEKLRDEKKPSILKQTMQLYNNLYKIKALFKIYKERTDNFINKNVDIKEISKIDIIQSIEDFEHHICIESFDEVLRKIFSQKMLQSSEPRTRNHFERKIFSSDRILYGNIGNLCESMPYPFTKDLPYCLKLKDKRQKELKWSEFTRLINSDSTNGIREEKDLQKRIVNIELLAKVCNRLLELYFSPPIYSIYKKEIKIDNKLTPFLDVVKHFQDKVKLIGKCLEDGNK